MSQFTQNAWGPVDFFDSPEVLDCSVTSIAGSGGAFLQVVATLAASCYRLFVRDGIQEHFIGVYVGAAGFEQLACVFGAGEGPQVDCYIPKGTRVSLRAMGASSITSGNLCILFMGQAPGFGTLNSP